jgi:hypothetical protein
MSEACLLLMQVLGNWTPGSGKGLNNILQPLMCAKEVREVSQRRHIHHDHYLKQRSRKGKPKIKCLA